MNIGRAELHNGIFSQLPRLKLNEQELLNRARKGDRTAFHTLVRQFEGRVAATVIGMIGYGPEADDIGQETFIRFYKALNQFRGQSTLGTYITRIAINLCLNEIKRRQKRRQVMVNDSEDRLSKLPDHKTEGNPAEARTLVHWGLQKLPPKFRSVLVLRLIDGYTSQETADILQLPLGTVLSRLARGQERLKQILAPVYQENIDSGV